MRTYRHVIQEHLANRISLNARYSLRALARDFGISAGQLSLVLSGKRGISPERAEKIFSRIGLPEDEIRFYLLQVEKEHARSRKKRDQAERELQRQDVERTRHSQLTQDAFRIVSDWYHFALLQVLSLPRARKLKSLEAQVDWAAKRLGLHAAETKSALERLARVELIELGERGYRVVHDTVFSTDGVSSSALRKFHRQILTRALAAIEAQSLSERYLNSILFPVRKSDLPAMRAEILKSQKMVLKKYGRVQEGDGDAVYALSQQLFRVTEEEK